MNRILFIMSILFCFNSAFGQTKTETTLTYFHYIPWNKALKAGDKQRFMQKCSTETDSILYGTLYLPKSGLNSVKHCNLTLRILNDTVYNFKITTNNKSNTKALIYEVTSQYGVPKDTIKQSSNIKYVWRDKLPNSKTIVSSLTISNNRKQGELTSEFE